VRGTRPAGIIDWEYAHVAPARVDVAYALAYGPTSIDGLMDEVIEVQRADLALVGRLAAEGHQRQVDYVRAGGLDELRKRVLYVAPYAISPVT
jgi:aminoglycoside phosphotransferase (APT) family kinase protein